MIRSNVGNIVTNAQQILSVGATTASALVRNREDLSTRLNNQKVEPLETATKYNENITKTGEVSYPEENKNKIEQKSNENPVNIIVGEDDYEVKEGSKLIDRLNNNYDSGQSKALGKYLENNLKYSMQKRLLNEPNEDFYTRILKTKENKGGKE